MGGGQRAQEAGVWHVLVTVFVCGRWEVLGGKAAAVGWSFAPPLCPTTRAAPPAFHFAIVFDSLWPWIQRVGVRQCAPQAVCSPQNSHKPQVSQIVVGNASATEKKNTFRSRKDAEGKHAPGVSPLPAPPLPPRLTATVSVPTCALECFREVLWTWQDSAQRDTFAQGEGMGGRQRTTRARRSPRPPRHYAHPHAQLVHH